MNGLIKLLYKDVDIVTSPVADIIETAIVSLILLLVIDDLSCCRIRIEIVVNVKSVDIIPFDDVVDHVTHIISSLGDAWVEYQLSIIVEHPVGR